MNDVAGCMGCWLEVIAILATCFIAIKAIMIIYGWIF